VSAENPNAHIYQSLIANLIIAVGKGVVAAITGSGAMLAETIHSTADCGNQLLLLVGVRRAKQLPDATHPLGYGRAMYFWSFIVALLLFTGGGVASIYEGLHKLHSTEPLESPAIAIGLLAFALAVEGWATLSNARDLDKRRGKIPFWQFLWVSKDSDLLVIFGENAAASLGLLIALFSVSLAVVTHNPIWDAIGTLGIGIILVLVAIFLAVKVKSLLVGESADPVIDDAVHEAVRKNPEFAKVLEIITLQQGPGEVVVAMKAEFYPHLSVPEVCDAINRFETDLRKLRPEAKWIFVEPDKF
jgi:cation diffusion facilitator family transporter